MSSTLLKFFLIVSRHHDRLHLARKQRQRKQLVALFHEFPLVCPGLVWLVFLNGLGMNSDLCARHNLQDGGFNGLRQSVGGRAGSARPPPLRER
jgi:hypothetical protein